MENPCLRSVASCAKKLQFLGQKSNSSYVSRHGRLSARVRRRHECLSQPSGCKHQSEPRNRIAVALSQTQARNRFLDGTTGLSFSGIGAGSDITESPRFLIVLTICRQRLKIRAHYGTDASGFRGPENLARRRLALTQGFLQTLDSGG